MSNNDVDDMNDGVGDNMLAVDSVKPPNDSTLLIEGDGVCGAVDSVKSLKGLTMEIEGEG